MSELFKAIKAEIARTPTQTGECRTCHEFIRSTPCLHADGSAHRSITGWEHVLTERTGCDPDAYPLGQARPA